VRRNRQRGRTGGQRPKSSFPRDGAPTSSVAQGLGVAAPHAVVVPLSSG
jgi:hypothetical protein